jgi:hypothetical protein
MGIKEIHLMKVNKTMSFNANDGTYFWSNGYQYGTIEVKDSGSDKTIVLTSENGELDLNSFALNGYGITKFRKGKTFSSGEAIELVVKPNDKMAGLPVNALLE